MKKIIIFAIISVILISCHNLKTMKTKTLTTNEVSMFIPGAPAIVYKTTKNFNDFVPVIMNEDRTKIVSYPDPVDLTYEGKLAKPTVLKNGYLLDNRGINTNVVFLKYTYEEYSKMTSPPSQNEMLLNIFEKYPLIEMYSCGLRNEYSDIIKDMNAKIDNGLDGCKKADIVPMHMTL